MENSIENNVWKNTSASEQTAPTLGKMLREARERLGLTVADVAGQIKFAPRQIEALEADDYPRLPETAFLRGFIRSYAKILHLDANTLLAALPQKKAAPVELSPELVGDPFPNVQSVLRQNYIWLGAALLLAIIAVVFALWHLTSPPAEPKPELVESQISLPAESQVAPPQVAPSPAGAAQTGSTKAGAPKTGAAKAGSAKLGAVTAGAANAWTVNAGSGVAATTPVASKKKPAGTVAHSAVQAADTVSSPSSLQKQTQAQTQTQTPATDTPSDNSPITMLRMVFNEESWAEIKDKNGKILSSRLHAPGSEMRVNGRAPFSLQIAKASSVGLFYKGKQIDLKQYINSQNDIARFTLE